MEEKSPENRRKILKKNIKSKTIVFKKQMRKKTMAKKKGKKKKGKGISVKKLNLAGRTLHNCKIYYWKGGKGAIVACKGTKG